MQETFFKFTKFYGNYYKLFSLKLLYSDVTTRRYTQLIILRLQVLSKIITQAQTFDCLRDGWLDWK